MQAEKFLRLLHDPHKITPGDVAALRNLLELYPYFQAAYALLAKVAYDQDQPGSLQAVQTAAVYATDRNHFKALLEDTPPFSAPALEEAMPAISAPEEEKATPNAGAYDFVNSYINTIKQKEQRTITNQKSLAQLESIQAFLQKNVNFKPQPLQAPSHDDFQADLTQKSTAFHDDLVTENLAQVLQQQGKLRRAWAIYAKLVLKFPEKKAYFAAIIEKLKRQI